MARLITIAVVILVVIGVALAAAGVLRFQNTTDESSITIDKKELKDKTQEAIEKTEAVGGKILDKTGETLHKAAEGLRGSPNDKDAPAEAAPSDDEGTRRSDGGKNVTEE